MKKQTPSGYKILAGLKSLCTPGESVTATRSSFHVFIPLAASGQGQAEPQEPSQIPEDFPFKSAECGDCHVEACCFLPAS